MALTDSDGNLIETYEYDVFGAPTTTLSGDTYNRFLFGGWDWDPDTALYNYGDVAYNPFIGRLLQGRTYYQEGPEIQENAEPLTGKGQCCIEDITVRTDDAPKSIGAFPARVGNAQLRSPGSLGIDTNATGIRIDRYTVPAIASTGIAQVQDETFALLKLEYEVRITLTGNAQWEDCEYEQYVKRTMSFSNPPLQSHNPEPSGYNTVGRGQIEGPWPEQAALGGSRVIPTFPPQFDATDSTVRWIDAPGLAAVGRNRLPASYHAYFTIVGKDFPSGKETVREWELLLTIDVQGTLYIKTEVHR